MICQNTVGKISTIVFTATFFVCIASVLSVPVNTFQSTSFTADDNGTHSVVLSGDDTSGTHVRIGSGPPMNSDSITSRFASPVQNQTTYYIPPGQDQTIRVRTGNSNTNIIARGGTTSYGGSSGGGSMIGGGSTSYSSPSGGGGVVGGGTTTNGGSKGSGGGAISFGSTSGAAAGTGMTRMGSSGTYAGSAAYAGAGNSGATAVAHAGNHNVPSSDEYNYNNDGYDS